MEYEIKVDFWKYCRRLSALISHVLKKLLSEKYNNFTTEKTKCCSATFGFAKLSSEASLRPGGRDSSLQELLLGVEQDVLVASDDGDPLPAQPGDRVGGGGGHRHGEGDLLRSVVQQAVSPHRICLHFPSPIAGMVQPSCVARVP